MVRNKCIKNLTTILSACLRLKLGRAKFLFPGFLYLNKGSCLFTNFLLFMTNLFDGNFARLFKRYARSMLGECKSIKPEFKVIEIIRNKFLP